MKILKKVNQKTEFMKILENDIAIIESDNFISKWVKQTGRLDHDQNMLPLLKEFIKEGDYVIDAGAYIGDHAAFYSKRVGDIGKVLAFEPLLLAFKCLEHNMRKYSNVYTYNNFLSNRKDKIKGISINFNNPGASHLCEGNHIVSMTIDEINLPKCDFIKIDVEGAELDVLVGAQHTINKYKPFLLVEINEGALKRSGISSEILIEHIKSLGYICRNIYAEQKMEGQQFDIICLPI